MNYNEQILQKMFEDKHTFPNLDMSNTSFQKKVLGYSHLPEAFLKELARVADQIPEEVQEKILTELDESAARELKILSEGYKVIADAEKTVRKEVETEEHAQEMQQADNIFTGTSSLSV